MQQLEFQTRQEGPDPVPRDRCPIVVDLDDCLLSTDVLWESLFVLLRKEPMAAIRLIPSITRGKAAFKDKLARLAVPDPAELPVRRDLLTFLKQADAAGRPIILATATHKIAAERIAEGYGLFSAVIATDDKNNLSGVRKLAAIRKMLGESAPFDYIGDAPVDEPLWRASRRAYVAHRSRRLTERVRRTGKLERVFEPAEPRHKAIPRAMRVHQWVKNALIFLPPLLAHRFSAPGVWLHAVLAFVAFSFCASGVYVLNDLFDLSSDRRHPYKRHRPFASGALPIRTGVLLVPLLFAASFALSLTLLPPAFTGALVLYVAATTAYSFWLKRVVLVDVLVLACLYALRVVAGGFATDVPVSQWLLAFSLFLFASLAFVKRYAELRHLEQREALFSHGRGYAVADLDMIRSIGTSAGLISVLVFTLYVSSEDVAALYANPNVLWLISPLLLYWIARMWLLAHRGRMHDDPIVFTARDPVSYGIGAAVALIGALAIVQV